MQQQQNNNVTVIPHVQGNVLELTIPLELTIARVVNGQISKTTEQYVPTNPVTVVLESGMFSKKLEAEVDGHLVHVIDNGTLPVGVYSITVFTRDENCKPLRFKKKTVVEVFDTTEAAGITPGVEFESAQWILDAAVFFGGISVNGIGEESDPTVPQHVKDITQEDIDDWNAKQEAISDLGQIRAGAAAGATALQPGALDGYATEDYVTGVRQRIEDLIDELMGANDVTDAIDTFNEIVAFLARVENRETLAGIIAGLNTSIAAKYTKPERGIPYSDLDALVQGMLTLASTAVQPSALNNYVTTSTLSGYYTKTEVDNLIPDVSGFVLSTSLATVATSGSYADLSDKPTRLSDFTNDIETPSVTVSATGDVSQALNPNTFYKFGAVDSLDLTLVAGTGLVVYFGRFTTSANWGGTGLTVPSGVTEGANNPTVEASKTYEFNIMDNVLLLMEV